MKKMFFSALFIVVLSTAMKAQGKRQYKPLAVKNNTTLQQQNVRNQNTSSGTNNSNNRVKPFIQDDSVLIKKPVNKITPEIQNQQNGANGTPAANATKLDDLKNPFDSTKKVKTIQQ